MIRILKILLLLMILSSCTTRVNTAKAQTLEMPRPIQVDRPIRVALVLGEGGSRGMAHLGVLEELEKANIPIDLIVGSSIGSFVGALYADQPDAHALKERVMDLKTHKLLSFNPFSARRGILGHKNMERFLKENISVTNFEDLKIPLIVASTDLVSGESIYLSRGEIIPTVCASCSIPFFFQPKEIYGKVLVDGMLTDPLPITVAKRYNPEVTIAVDLSGLLIEKPPKNIFEVTKRSFDILKIEHNQNKAMQADIVIKPKIGSNITFINTKHSSALYEAGREAALEHIEEIRLKLSEQENRVHPQQLVDKE